MTPLTILTNDAPDPTDDKRRGRGHATHMVIGGAAAAELWEFHASDGAVTRFAELTIDGYDGQVRFFDPAALRDLAAVATELADRLEANN